jgi:hypothetical protein
LDINVILDRNNAWPILRLILGVIAGPLMAIAVALVLPVERAGQPTMSSMGNIAYLVLFTQHVILVSALYSILSPAVFPAASSRAKTSLMIGGFISVCLLVLLAFRLDVMGPSPDYFALVTWKKAMVGSVVSVVVSFFVGMNGNRLLKAKAMKRL